MVYKIMSIDNLDDEHIKKYFPMLTDARKRKIASMRSVDDRSIAFCAEIVARQCLSELCDAPEFSFSLLCNPNSKSVVGNFNAEICIVNYGRFVACAASENFVGISIMPVLPFTFRDAQKMLSDSEIRRVFSESVYGFAELVNLPECNEENVKQKYALFSALKEACYFSSGRGIRSEIGKTYFDLSDDEINCSDPACKVAAAYINIESDMAVAVVERRKV